MSILRDRDAHQVDPAPAKHLVARATGTFSRMVSRLDAFFFRRAWRQPEEATIFSARPPEQFGRVPWTAPILVLGDNQLQHEFGEPDSVSNMLDRWSEPSVRPPLTMLFGHALLERELAANTAAAQPILHLGDALNTSCRSEYQRFRAVLDTALARHDQAHPKTALPFAMLPGNHDGFFLGNFQSHLSSVSTGQSLGAKLWRAIWNAQGLEWRCRCTDTFGELAIERAVFNKNDFLLEYLDLLGATHQIARLDPSAEIFEHAIENGRAAEVFIAGHQDAYFQGALLKLEPQAPHHSYLVQVLRLPRPAQGEDTAPVYLMLLDSTNYRWRRSRAGMCGDLCETQYEAALSLWRRLDPPVGARLLFACHHNLGALKIPARRRLARLALGLARERKTVVLPVVLTAHRHRGGWYTNDTRGTPCWGRSVRFTDLNLSSMVDWPIATREFTLWGLPTARREELGAAAERRYYALRAPLREILPRAELEHYAAVPLYRQIADRILVERRSPLQRDPVRRIMQILGNSLRDRYVAEYAILYEMGGALLVLLGLAYTHLPAPSPQSVANQALVEALRRAMAQAPLDFEAGFEAGRSIALFENLRRAVFQAWRCLDDQRAHAAFGEDIDRLVALGALEDYHRQWRNWGKLPGYVADRWYRCAANLDEAYALVRSLEPDP